MNAEAIYQKAIKALHHQTYGRFEHDEEVAIELFDKLLDRGAESHCDDVKRMCEDAGYDSYASKEIGQIYDVIHIYKQYKKAKFPPSWTEDMIDDFFD